MLSTCSWDAGAAGAESLCPPQAAVKRAALSPAPIALYTRQFRMNPFVKLPDDVLLGHDDSAHVRRGAQAALVQFAHLRVLRHDQVREVHDIAHVEFRVGKSLRRKQVLD